METLRNTSGSLSLPFWETRVPYQCKKWGEKKVFPNKENLPLQTKNLEAELGARAF